VNTNQDDILTRRLDAMGRALMSDPGPAPVALVSASRAMVQERTARWGYAGMALAASLLIGSGAVAIWAAVRPGPPTRLPGNREGEMTAHIDSEPAADVNVERAEEAPSNTPTVAHSASPTGTPMTSSAPTMGDLRGAVNDPVAGDPRVGGSLSPRR
jgi:hypothetical protein